MKTWVNPTISRTRRTLGRGERSTCTKHASRREYVDAVAIGLVDRVTRRMRAAGRVGRTVVLRLRFDDFSRATRSHSLPRATAQTGAVLTSARELLLAASLRSRA